MKLTASINTNEAIAIIATFDDYTNDETSEILLGKKDLEIHEAGESVKVAKSEVNDGETEISIEVNSKIAIKVIKFVAKLSGIFTAIAKMFEDFVKEIEDAQKSIWLEEEANAEKNEAEESNKEDSAAE